jgi:hypothetical protein
LMLCNKGQNNEDWRWTSTRLVRYRDDLYRRAAVDWSPASRLAFLGLYRLDGACP